MVGQTDCFDSDVVSLADLYAKKIQNDDNYVKILSHGNNSYPVTFSKAFHSLIHSSKETLNLLVLLSLQKESSSTSENEQRKTEIYELVFKMYEDYQEKMEKNNCKHSQPKINGDFMCEEEVLSPTYFTFDDFNKNEIFKISIGNQLKSFFILKLSCEELFNIATSSDQLFNAKRANILTSLYSENQLIAKVIPFLNLNEIIGTNPYCNDNGFLDFHFASLKDQIKNIQSLDLTFSPGRFFITKHSVLDDAHCIFHLAIKPTTDNYCSLTESADVIAGLTKIIKLCSENNIFTIILCLPLLTQRKRPNENLLKETEFFLKCLKGMMQEALKCRLYPDQLMNITLVIPKENISLFQSFREIIAKQFKNSMTF